MFPLAIVVASGIEALEAHTAALVQVVPLEIPKEAVIGSD